MDTCQYSRQNSACSVLVFEQAEFWREENIKAFGGNLDNVTLFGQSSGSLPMKESQLHNGCINWCKHQIELGYTPSYGYYFNHRLPGDGSGAFHSSELWYMFGTLDRCWRSFTDKDRQLSEKCLIIGVTLLRQEILMVMDWKNGRFGLLKTGALCYLNDKVTDSLLRLPDVFFDVLYKLLCLGGKKINML